MRITQRIAAISFVFLCSLPFVIGQQQSDARKDARELIVRYEQKLGSQKPQDIVAGLKALEEIAEEVHRSRYRVPQMLRHRDPEVRKQAAKTLGAFGLSPDDGDQRVIDLMEGLKDRDPDVVIATLVALARQGQSAAPAVPKAVELFKSENPRVRRAAIIVWGDFATSHNLIPLLIAALDDPDVGADPKKPGYNSVSMGAMVRLPRSAKEAVPKLIQIVKDKKHDDVYQKFALNALVHIAPENPFAIEIIRGWLRHTDDPQYIGKACGMFHRLGKHGTPAVPELVAALQAKSVGDANTEQKIKIGLLTAIRSIGPEAKAALPTVRGLIGTGNLTVRREVIETIRVLEDGR